jgi:hypothetical protein
MTVLQEIVSYIIEHHQDLGFPAEKKRWASQLRNRSVELKLSISERAIQLILKGEHGDVRDELLNRLAGIFQQKPSGSQFEVYTPLANLTRYQFRLRSLAAFKDWEAKEREAAQSQLGASSPSGDARSIRGYKFEASTHPGTPLAHYHIVIPARREPRNLTRGQAELHYVTWRYALESVVREPRIAREVLTIRRKDDLFDAIMTYKLGADDAGGISRVFAGPILSLGESHICVMVEADETSPDWSDRLCRARAMFFPVRPGENGHLTRFGLLSTTRERDYDPCAACTVMLLVEGAIDDIREFQHKVTVIRPAEEIFEHDFGRLPKDDQDLLWEFLSNVPRGINSDYLSPDFKADRVLRLHSERFEENMPRMRQDIIGNGHKNPIIEDWKSEGVLLAR